jgi:hypothetical protein
VEVVAAVATEEINLNLRCGCEPDGSSSDGSQLLPVLNGFLSEGSEDTAELAAKLRKETAVIAAKLKKGRLQRSPEEMDLMGYRMEPKS